MWHHKSTAITKISLFNWASSLHLINMFERNNLGPDSIKKCHLTSIGNPIVEIRRSYDRLISTMGFPIPVRRHLYIESGPRSNTPENIITIDPYDAVPMSLLCDKNKGVWMCGICQWNALDQCQWLTSRLHLRCYPVSDIVLYFHSCFQYT